MIVSVTSHKCVNKLTGSEWHHTGPQVTGVEGHVDARKRNRGKPSFQLDESFRLLLVLGLFEAFLDDFAQHLPDLVSRKLCKELYPRQF